MKRFLPILLFAALAFCGCEELDLFPEPQKEVNKDKDKYGMDRVYGSEAIPSIRISVPLDQWNALRGYYDENNKTKKYVSCDVEYNDGASIEKVSGAGLRLRGNTSRRRPEGEVGETHNPEETVWHHCHFGVHLDKFTKDDDHRIKGIRKMNLKWFKDDPNYVREIYCYDLFQRAGVWTAPHSKYCLLWLKVEGDPAYTYFGVYELLEPIDTRFLKARKEGFGDAGGNLWKCRWGASLNSTNADFGLDDGTDAEHTYEFKGEKEAYGAAEAQLKDFILKLTGKGEDSFYQWIQEVCDVPLLLKTYAVNVTVGMWDDYWNNQNNYYIYFNATDKYAYKFYFIPFDYDNTLGTSLMMDAGRKDPLNWGDDSNLLIRRLLRFDDFRQIYKDALLELVDPDKALFYYTASIQRITDWQNSIKDFVENDTGEDCMIYDEPAPWGNMPNYRLLTEGPDNFFQVKTQTILNTCK